MRTTEVLQKCLRESLKPIHALRVGVLMRAVEAVVAGRRLTLIDLARAWPGAERIRAPLKALDRLLGNPHLHAERERLHAAMNRWLVRSDQPVIVVDWSNLKADGITVPGSLPDAHNTQGSQRCGPYRMRCCDCATTDVRRALVASRIWHDLRACGVSCR